MEDQKLENLLNLALDATEEEREKSVSLDVGYDAENRTWQVIVRHSGALRQLIAQRYPDVSWQITELSGGYAIVDLPRKDMDKLVRMLQVFYVEKHKIGHIYADYMKNDCNFVRSKEKDNYNL